MKKFYLVAALWKDWKASKKNNSVTSRNLIQFLLASGICKLSICVASREIKNYVICNNDEWVSLVSAEHARIINIPVIDNGL